MRRFYKEPNGAYLSVELSTLPYFQKELNEDAYEGRSCVTYAPDPSYVNTGTISVEYLKECERVLRRDVPKVWLERL